MTTIIVPIETEKECIIQDNKKYCEQSDMSPREFGGAILIFIALVWYIIYITTKNNLTDKQVGIRLAAPFVILALILLIFG